MKQNEKICVFWMNIEVEKKWNKNMRIFPDVKTSISQQEIIKDTEQMCLLLKGKSDIVILREPIPELVKLALKQCDIETDNIIIPKNATEFENISEAILSDYDLLGKLRELNIKLKNRVKLVPYAVTEIEEKISLQTKCELIGPNAKMARWINNKIHSREIAQKLGFPITQGKICHSKLEIIDFYEKEIKKNPKAKFVVKEAVGASGKGLYLIKNKNDYEIMKFMLDRRKEKTIKILIEYWYDSATSLNYQIYCDGNGNSKIVDITRQLVDNTVYKGSQSPDFIFHCTIQLEKYIEKLKKFLEKINYKGIASVDAIIVDEKFIYPIIEINGRLSLSSYPVIWKKKNRVENICRFFYVNLKYDSQLDTLEKYIRKNLFSLGREGIVPYVYSPSKNKSTEGRIFLAIIGNTVSYIEKIQKEILAIVKA